MNTSLVFALGTLTLAHAAFAGSPPVCTDFSGNYGDSWREVYSLRQVGCSQIEWSQTSPSGQMNDGGAFLARETWVMDGKEHSIEATEQSDPHFRKYFFSGNNNQELIMTLRFRSGRDSHETYAAIIFTLSEDGQTLTDHGLEITREEYESNTISRRNSVNSASLRRLPETQE